MWELILHALAGVGGLCIMSLAFVCVMASRAVVDNSGWTEERTHFANTKPADPVREKAHRLVELRQRNRADITATGDRIAARLAEAKEMFHCVNPEAQIAAMQFVAEQESDDVDAATTLRERLRVASGHGTEPS